MKLLAVIALALAALLAGCAVVPYDPYYNGYHNGYYGGGPYYSGAVVVGPPVVVGGYYSHGYRHWH
jgi:hypothetical protein